MTHLQRLFELASRGPIDPEPLPDTEAASLADHLTTDADDAPEARILRLEQRCDALERDNARLTEVVHSFVHPSKW